MTSFTNTTLNYPQLANTAIRRVKANHAPNTIKNFILGDEWLDTSASPAGDWWKLSTLPAGGLVWVRIGGGGSQIETLTGNTGGPVPPDAINDNINLLGAGGVSIAGNPGTNTLTVSSASISAWVDVTSTPTTLVPNIGYVADTGVLCVFTLPLVSSFGDIIVVMGRNTGGWIIMQNPGQTMFDGLAQTTVGVAGSIRSTNQHDVITLVCTSANTEWTTWNAVGNLTVI